MQISRIGPFALEEPLGGDADSNVLRGIHIELKQSMAVKLLDRTVVDRPMGGSTFADDVRRLQKLIDPHIVRTFGGAVQDGQPYLALEYVVGESLRQRLDRRRKLAWETAVEIIEPVCEALHYLHGNQWVHRRLTPDRILLAENGEVKITGLDCVWSDCDDVPGLRLSMDVAHYLSPEQFRGHASVNLPACDLYSLGVILYECLTGELPWAAETPAELVLARREGPAPRVSATVLECPVWLDLLVAKLLEKKRSQRLGSADEARRAIANAKLKVAKGAGAAQAAMSGRQGSLTAGLDRSELRKIRSKPVKRRDDSPIYERPWFLAGCLAGIAGFVFWITRPDSEQELFAKALPLMQSEKPTDWRRADEQYLKELRERFPATQYADQLRAFDDRYAMHRAEMRIENLDRFGRDPENEAQRRYAAARRMERFGDRYAAWTQYESIIELFADSEDPEERALANLARRQASGIEASGNAATTGQQLIEQRLAEVEQLVAAGQLLEARRTLRNIDRLYRNNRELTPLVKEARERLLRLDEQSP